MSQSEIRSVSRLSCWKNTVIASRMAPYSSPAAENECGWHWMRNYGPLHGAPSTTSGTRFPQSRLPPPLKDSPKCPRCALVSVCLPDEIQTLLGSDLAPRPIAVPRDTALPLIVQSQYARISKDGETLKVIDEEQGEKRVRLIDVSDVALFGNVYITTPALSALFEREIPVTYHSHGGSGAWLTASAIGMSKCERRSTE